jgi:hypothetical protein
VTVRTSARNGAFTGTGTGTDTGTDRSRRRDNGSSRSIEGDSRIRKGGRVRVVQQR